MPISFLALTLNFMFSQIKYRVVKVKIKQSHYRPGQAQGVPGG